MQVNDDDRAQIGNSEDDEYHRFVQKLQYRFLENIRTYGPLFTTKSDNLWESYLNALPEHTRQYHNCNACKNFVRKYGSLVVVNETGDTHPAIWDVRDASGDEVEPIRALVNALTGAKITGVFLSSEEVWGDPITGIWHHFGVYPPKDIMHKDVTKTAGQAMAEKKEDFKNMIRALQDFTIHTVRRAVDLISTDALYQSQKVKGPADWFLSLHIAISTLRGTQRTNIIWEYVADAPPGFCHPRSSMIGTLLEDLTSGIHLDACAARFQDKMHPLQYQRPQAPPSRGNIEQAEKLVEQMGIQDSLKRRFARLDEIQAIWRQPVVEDVEYHDGVFGHIRAKDEALEDNVELTTVTTMTWNKFQQTVLDNVAKIEFYVPSNGAFTAILTAAVIDAPPILQWDLPEQRNPFSLYFYHNGSQASQWNLEPRTFVNVPAITKRPEQWFHHYEHMREGIVFILSGAVDTRDNQGNALFPETMKSELHAVRSTIEAYSQSAKIEGRDTASACGVVIDKSEHRIDLIFRVTTTSGLVMRYKIDRID